MAADVIIDPSNGQIYWNDSAGVGTQSISIKGDAVDAISFIGYGAAFSPGSTPSGPNTRVTINDRATETLIPGTSGHELGSATYRWKFYGTTGNFSDTTNSTSLITGAILVNGGIAISGNASIGQTLFIFNGSNYAGFRFAGSSQTTYTLPSSTPAGVGASFLSSGTDGTMAWIPAPSSSGGTPGGSNKQIQYNNATVFGGAAGFEYVTGGTAVTVSIFNNAGAGYTAGLWIHAINSTTTRVGIGLSNPAYELEINGEISATNKSFVIDHPTKKGMKLRYGSLEGPENGVYVRGELIGSNIIVVPDHWIGLVHPDTYTVHITPIGKFAQLYVEKIEDYNVFIASSSEFPIHCFYSVWAERKDIPKLITEY